MPPTSRRPARPLLLLGLLALAAACGSPSGPSAPSSPAPAVPGLFLAEATAVRVLPHGAGLAIRVRLPAGDDGCATRPRARREGSNRRVLHVGTVYDHAGGDCPEQRSAVVVLDVPPRGRDLALNHELWEPTAGGTYVRCGELGCDPPRDPCDPGWVDTLTYGVELPPEQQVAAVVCRDGWLVADVDAVVSGCQPRDGATPPASCRGTGVHTRYFARLAPGRRWQVVASGTGAGCADVAQVPGFPRALCARLPPRAG